MTGKTSQPFSLGFIGGGLNSAIGLTHRIAVEMDRRFALKAGCFSTHQSVNHQTGHTWGVEKHRIYDDWLTLISEEQNRLDAIVILTPIPSHANIAIQVMKAGYPVISEKALASSSADAEKIRAAVEEQNAFLAVTYNYSGYPMLRELKMMIKKGALGKIFQIHAEMPQEGFIRLYKDQKNAPPQAWRLDDPETLSTVSLDLCAHLHHIIFFLTGNRPIELAAMQDSFGTFQQVCDNGMCLARYTNEMVCQLWYSKCALGHRNGLRIRVYGTQGSAEWYQMDPEHLRYVNIMGQVSTFDRTNVLAQVRYNRFKAGHPAGFIEAFANMYYDIADSLLEFQKTGRYASSWNLGVDIAKEGLHMLEAISRSAQRKTWEKII
ncbi:MAG: Gfo/Idh/MocA family oxidoreductase [Candidatus Electrothrix scaldis]|nr:MAG: Gfo/Idh/MocA family oxidoreductase [Candidatus Electrothrix sp. GW3-3]